MATKNGQAVSTGKAGTYDVTVAYTDRKTNESHNATAKVTITAEVIAAVRKAVKAFVGDKYVNKKGQTVTPSGAHTTFPVKIDGQRAVFSDTLLAIAETLDMLPTAKAGPTELSGLERRMTLLVLSAGLEQAGVIVSRSALGGALIYLPENAPTGGGRAEISGKDALAKILA